MPKLFDAWGVSYDAEKVVLDAGHALSVGGRRGTPVRHLAYLGFDADSMDRDDVVTAGLNTLNLGFAGSIAPKEGAQTTFTPLLHSSDQAMIVGAEKFRFLPDPAQLMDGYYPGRQGPHARRARAGEGEDRLPRRLHGAARARESGRSGRAAEG
jgi:ABC-type uncharacterized transport system involved in gliding motility auxiliary subunit